MTCGAMVHDAITVALTPNDAVDVAAEASAAAAHSNITVASGDVVGRMIHPFIAIA